MPNFGVQGRHWFVYLNFRGNDRTEPLFFRCVPTMAFTFTHAKDKAQKPTHRAYFYWTTHTHTHSFHAAKLSDTHTHTLKRQKQKQKQKHISIILSHIIDHGERRRSIRIITQPRTCSPLATQGA